MLLESRGYITSHPRVNKRVQQAEEGLPYLHLTYFILWESSILKGKERRRNCWGGLLAAGWATVFKEPDKWEISPESTKRVNTLFLSLLFTTRTPLHLKCLNTFCRRAPRCTRSHQLLQPCHLTHESSQLLSHIRRTCSTYSTRGITVLSDPRCNDTKVKRNYSINN